jgi:hypothetical protein
MLSSFVLWTYPGRVWVLMMTESICVCGTESLTAAANLLYAR